MKYSLEACARDKVIIALNADIYKYIDYGTNASSNAFGNICMRCHDSERLNVFGVPKIFPRQNSEFTKIVFPEKFLLK